MPTPTTMKSKLSSVMNGFQLIKKKKKTKKELLLSPIPRGQLLGRKCLEDTRLHWKEGKKTKPLLFSSEHTTEMDFLCALFLFYTMFIWKYLLALNSQKISKALLRITFLTEHSFLTTCVEHHLWSLPLVPYKHLADPRENQGPTNHRSQIIGQTRFLSYINGLTGVEEKREHTLQCTNGKKN